MRGHSDGAMGPDMLSSQYSSMEEVDTIPMASLLVRP